MRDPVRCGLVPSDAVETWIDRNWYRDRDAVVRSTGDVIVAQGRCSTARPSLVATATKASNLDMLFLWGWTYVVLKRGS